MTPRRPSDPRRPLSTSPGDPAVSVAHLWDVDEMPAKLTAEDRLKPPESISAQSVLTVTRSDLLDLLVESIIGTLKGPTWAGAPWHPHPQWLWVRVAQRLMALAAGAWFNWQPGGAGVGRRRVAGAGRPACRGRPHSPTTCWDDSQSSRRPGSPTGNRQRGQLPSVIVAAGSNRIEEVPVDAAVRLPAWPADDGRTSLSSSTGGRPRRRSSERGHGRDRLRACRSR